MPRRLFWTFAALAVAAFLPWAVPVSADQTPAGAKSIPAGSGLYSTYCAVCHGTNGKGTGPLADSLKRRPADLTMLAKNNGGTYNRDLVRQIIGAGTWAPSSGNMQAWEFGRQGNAAEVFLQRQRVLPTDVHGMFGWVGLGAALENLVSAAARHGLASQVDYETAERPGAPAAVVGLSPGGAGTS